MALLFGSKRFRKLPRTRKPTYIKTGGYRHARRLPERPPCVRTSLTRNNSSSSECCSSLFPLFFCKNLVEHALRIGRKCKCPKKLFEENEKDQCQERITDDLTRPWLRPGEFIVLGNTYLQKHILQVPS